MNVVTVLGETRDPRAAPPLLSMLHDGNQFIAFPDNRTVLKAIATIKHHGAVEPLITLLEKAEVEKNGTKRYIYMALIEIAGQDAGRDPEQWRTWWEQNGQSLVFDKDKPPASLKHWGVSATQSSEFTRKPDVHLLISELKHPDSRVRRAAGQRMARIGNPDDLQPAVQPLLKALENTQDTVRWRYAEVLGNTADPRVVDPLLVLLAEGDNRARSAAAKALGKLGDDRDVGGLIGALVDPHYYVSNSAADALGQIHHPDGIDAMLSFLRDTDRDRRHIVGVIAKINEPRAIEHLIPLLREQDPYLKIHTERSLEKITGQDFGQDADQWRQWWDDNKERLLAEGS